MSHAAVVSTLIVVLKFVEKLFHGTFFDMMIPEADSQGQCAEALGRIRLPVVYKVGVIRNLPSVL